MSVIIVCTYMQYQPVHQTQGGKRGWGTRGSRRVVRGKVLVQQHSTTFLYRVTCPAAQVNVELLTIDKRSFTTDEGSSLLTLFGESSEGSAQYRAEVSLIASRLATVFASLKVWRYWEMSHTSALMHLSQRIHSTLVSMLSQHCLSVSTCAAPLPRTCTFGLGCNAILQVSSVIENGAQ